MSKKAKILIIVPAATLLVAISIIVMSALGLFSPNQEEIPKGNKADVEWYSEDGTEFVITTTDEFYGLLELSNYYNFSGQTIKLGKDIIVNTGKAEDWSKQSPVNLWYPITGFAGVFDGCGHTISGVCGKGVETEMGLFADTDMNAVIRDFRLENSYFEVTGAAGCGSISATGGGKFERIYSNAIVNCKGHYGAGMIGRIRANTTMTECWYDGEISTLKRTAGGLVSEVTEGRLLMEHCYFTGKLTNDWATSGPRVGGLVGRICQNTLANLTDCLSAGSVVCANTSLAGSVVAVCEASSTVTLEGCWTVTDGFKEWCTASGQRGTITGLALGGERQEYSGYEAYRWMNLDFEKEWAVVLNDIPVLQCFAKDIPSLKGAKRAFSTDWYKKSESLYTLNTQEDLFGFYIVSGSTNFEGKRVVLGGDITVNEGNAKNWGKKAPELIWKPIRKFSGVFDGQGHTIRGLYAKSDSQKIGFISETTLGSHVRNIRIENSYFEHTGEAMAYVGSIAGRCRGSMDTLYSNAIIVSSGKENGGLIGVVDGTAPVSISNCWFDGTIELYGKNGRYSGGLIGCVGSGEAVLQHGLNTGSIHCRATDAGSHIGGLVGWTKTEKTKFQVKDCLSAGKITVENVNQVGSVIGRIATGSTTTISDVYATQECYEKTFGLVDAKTNTVKAATRQGMGISYKKDLLTGNKGYQWTTLDFQRFWAVSKNGTPVLLSFAKTVPSVKGLSKVFDTKWYNETANVYTLKSRKDLYGFFVISGNTNFEKKTVRLGADITVNQGNAADWEAAAPGMPWTPVGEFAGTFDGKGHTISGLYVDATVSNAGLFAETTPGSTIKDVRLKNSYFSSQVEGSANIGSIAGIGNGTFDTLYSDAIITSKGKYSGGLVGRISKKGKHVISNCWFDGALHLKEETGRYGGGLVGSVLAGSTTIEHCQNTAEVTTEAAKAGVHIGGVTGFVSNADTVCAIKDTFCAGTMKPSKNVNQVGSAIGRIGAPATASLTNVYALDSCYSTAVGLVDAATKEIAAATKKGDVLRMPISMLRGYGSYQRTTLNFDKYWAVVEGKAPALRSFAATIPSLTGVEKLYSTGWYKSSAATSTVNTAKDLYGLYILSATTDFSGKTIKLGKDIVINSGSAGDWESKAPANTWLPILKFAGTFDGQKHTISGLYIDANEKMQGFFAETTTTGIIKNLKLTNSYIQNVYTGNSYTGSIVGSHSGTLDTVYTDAILNCHGKDVGGIAGGTTGKGEHKIVNCVYAGTITLKGEDGRYAGGILGTANGGTSSISHVLNTGNISAEAKKAGSHIGGIAGSTKNKDTILKVTDTLNMGKIQVANTNQVGSAIGRIQNDTSGVFEDVYVTEDSYKNAVGLVDKAATGKKAGEQKGKPIVTPGYTLIGNGGCVYTHLNFKKYWSGIKGSMPMLTSFASGEVLSVAGSSDTGWYEKNLETKKYTIQNEGEFYGLTILSKTYNFSGWTLTLGRDLELSKDIPWMPIGENTSALAFKGTFDGNYHTIKGICIDNQEEGSPGTGLFRQTETGSVVKNLRLVESTIMSAGQYVGSIAGVGNGTFQNIYSSAKVISTYDGVTYAGGLIGQTSKGIKISNCQFAGTVSLTASNGRVAGCLIGRIPVDSTLEHCLNTGTITAVRSNYTDIGGLVGGLYTAKTVLTIKDSLHLGLVEAPNASDGYLGAIVGTASAGTARLENTYAKQGGCIKKGSVVADKVSHITSGTVTITEKGLTITDIFKDENSLIGEKAYRNTWLDFANSWAAVAEKLPELLCFMQYTGATPLDLTDVSKPETEWFTTTEASADGKKHFTITTVGQLEGVSLLSQTQNFEGWVLTLGADLSLNDVSNNQNKTWTSEEKPKREWTPIGGNVTSLAFAGEFNGGGHTLKGIYVSTADGNGTGLFRGIAAGGKVHNLKLTHSYIESTGDVVGGIAGQGHGTIEKIYVGNTTVKGASHVGGVVGLVNGGSSWLISECHFDGQLYSDGSNGVGGILGAAIKAGNKGVMQYCLNTGAIRTTSTASTSFAGGLFGRLANSGVVTFTNCVNAGTIHVEKIIHAGSIVGKGGSGTFNFNKTYGVKGKITYGESDTVSDTAYYTNYSGASIYLNGAKISATKPTTAALDSAVMVEEADLYAKGNESGNLDSNYWTVQTGKVPSLKNVPSSSEERKNLLMSALSKLLVK